MKYIQLPFNDEVVRSLKVGDPVALSGVMVTGRDNVHKWMVDTFIKKDSPPAGRRRGSLRGDQAITTRKCDLSLRSGRFRIG